MAGFDELTFDHAAYSPVYSGFDSDIFDTQVFDEFRTTLYHTTSSLQESQVRRTYDVSSLDEDLTVQGRTYSPDVFAWKYNFANGENALSVTGSYGSTLLGFLVHGQPSAVPAMELNITERESEPSEWEIPIRSPYARHSHENELSGWKNVLGGRNLMQFACSYAGDIFTYEGYGGGNALDRSPGSPIADFSWRGQDHSQKLLVGGISMDPVINGLASTAVREVLVAAGVFEFNLYQLQLDDWVIPNMPRINGRYIDFIQAILEVMGLEWKMVEGRIFTVYLPDVRGDAVSWSYGTDGVIRKLGDTNSLEPVVNQITVKILREIQGVVKGNTVTARVPTPGTNTLPGSSAVVEQNDSAPGTEVLDFGEYTVNFSPPLNGVSYNVLAAEGGIFSDFVFRNAKGNVISVRSPRGASSIPQSSTGFGFQIPTTGTEGLYAGFLLGAQIIGCTSVTFTWGEAPGTNAPSVDVTGGYGRIEFSGVRPVPQIVPPTPQPLTEAPDESADADSNLETEVPAYDPEFAVVVNDYESQGYYGKVYPLELSPTTIMGDTGTMQKSGMRRLRKISRQAKDVTMIVPLNLRMELGHVIGFYDKNLGKWRRVLAVGIDKTITTIDPKKKGLTLQGKEYFLG